MLVIKCYMIIKKVIKNQRIKKRRRIRKTKKIKKVKKIMNKINQVAVVLNREATMQKNNSLIFSKSSIPAYIYIYIYIFTFFYSQYFEFFFVRFFLYIYYFLFKQHLLIFHLCDFYSNRIVLILHSKIY